MLKENDLLGAFEVHSPEGIREALAAGVSPVDPIKGKTPMECLIEAYLRSPRFADCLRVLLEAGATIADPLLEAVLLDDVERLDDIVAASRESLHRKLRPLCAFTSCRGVSALHLCAEFNSVRCARALIEAGADVNARADRDAAGLGGQTPIFHAVNSIYNHGRPTMDLLLDAGADLEVRVEALLWGESCDWETIVFDVTPISFAQCGLYRQFHRREDNIYSNIAALWRKRYGKEPPIRNVPNRYVQS